MKTFEDIIATPLILQILPTGSFYICSPPVKGTDRDFVLLVSSLEKFQNYMEKSHSLTYSCLDEFEYDLLGTFLCWRLGKYNFIVTDDPIWADKWRLATLKAKTLNLLKKEERIKLFRKYLDED